ncbi:MAG: ABC transporter ATP-binding protein [Oscillospiraceae bacterium]|nr:ABC transporter ATP-binding protein [Oscillospiraceae bacterium]
MEAEILDVKKRYGRKEVLRGTSFRVAAGSCMGILGANGSGKTTLLKIMAGVLRPDGGRFLWQGEDLLRSAARRAEAVAYVPQGTPLIEELSARDNLRLWYSPEALECSLDSGVLRQLGVDEFLKTTASRLSGGMRKRLSIGCALARDPAILLLDEPTAALDLVCKERILRCFEDFRQAGGLLVMVSHDPWELEMCDDWRLLRGGLLESYTYTGERRALIRDLEQV